MKIFWVEYNNGIQDRDEVFVLNENEALAPQATIALRERYQAGNDEPYELGDIYPLQAAAPDGTMYAISLTPQTTGTASDSDQ